MIFRAFTFLMFLAWTVTTAFADIQVINGVRYECKDGMCQRLDDEEVHVTPPSAPAPSPYRIAQGYMGEDDFVRFVTGERERDALTFDLDFGSLSFYLGLLAILLGGLAMNLTPCVLPMIPVNVMIIGASAVRGAWYGLGIALAYGALGVAAAFGSLAFGTIQGSPWFNLAIALIFLALALSLSGVFFIDFSKRRATLAQKKATMLPWLFAFFMGIVSAVLAGACVAPILISVLVLTLSWYAKGHTIALLLPFVFGLGMALPWPFLGAGMKVLPKPGAWMKAVNRLFALVVLVCAIWYGRLAVLGFMDAPCATSTASVTPATFEATLAESKRPVLVDCWATWCKNCAAMDRVLEGERARAALEGYTVLKLQAEDMTELKRLKGFESIRGLPAFVIIEK